MSANSGHAAQGVVIKMGDGASPEVYSTVANVIGMQTSGQTMEMIDATHLNSTSGFREKLPSFKDGGTVTLKVCWDPSSATHSVSTGLKGKYDNKTLTHFKIDCTGTTPTTALVISFSAYVSNVGFAADVGQLLQRDITLTISGAVTEAAS